MNDLVLSLVAVLTGGVIGVILGWTMRADRAALEILGEYAKGWNDGHNHARSGGLQTDELQ